LLVDGPNAIANGPPRDRVLWAYRTAAAALRKGDFALARQMLDEALLTIGGLRVNDKEARKARGYFTGEAKKTFIGEPYERCMAYLYRGILYWMEGEPDNARACFRSAAVIDGDTEKQEYAGDWVLAEYLDGLATTKLAGDGSDAFKRAQAVARGVTLPPYRRDFNVLFFFEFGPGPTKYATGEFGEQLRFRVADSPVASAQLKINGATYPIAPTDDVFFQATTRGGRVMDHILGNKAVFKGTTDAVGDAALIGGLARPPSAGPDHATGRIGHRDGRVAQQGAVRRDRTGGGHAGVGQPAPVFEFCRAAVASRPARGHHRVQGRLRTSGVHVHQSFHPEHPCRWPGQGRVCQRPIRNSANLMKNTGYYLALLIPALALLTGCQTDHGAYAPQNTQVKNLEDSARFVLLDKGAQRSVTSPGIQDTRLPDGRLQVQVNLRNRENRRIQIQVNCVFKDAMGFVVEDTPFSDGVPGRERPGGCDVCVRQQQSPAVHHPGSAGSLSRSLSPALPSNRVPMAVENRIVKVQKRNRALVKFDAERILRAIWRAADSIGGFEQDRLPGINEPIFQAWGTDERIAEFLAEAVVVCLNSDPHHLIANFPPTIEVIQDEVLHTLRSYGFQNTADAYACYRWGRHWLREGAITPEKFVGNGFPAARMESILETNRRRGCDTVAGLNELTRSGRLGPVIEASLADYEASLDQAARKVLERLNRGTRCG
jgi:hypothetical protein